MTLNSITPSRRGGRTGRLRLGGLPAVLALAITLALGAPRADAQPAPQLGTGFPALSLTYTDAEGPGTAVIMPHGPDTASGGTVIGVRIVQNDITYAGDGFVRPGELGGFVIDFTVYGAFGERYHLSGRLIHDDDGVRWRGRGQWWATWNRAVNGEWYMAGGPFAEPPQLQLWTTVRLEPASKSAVRGSVTLLALPDGETRFDLALAGLVPGAAYAVQLHAGTPNQPSASFTQLVTVHAGAFGQASAGGLVRFRGTEAIPLLDIADGDHIITVVGFGRTVAVGRIPVLQPLG